MVVDDHLWTGEHDFQETGRPVSGMVSQERSPRVQAELLGNARGVNAQAA